MASTPKISYEFELDPVPKPRMTRRDKWDKRPCVVRYWSYCNNLQAEAQKQNYTPSKTLSLIFVIPMPNSWSKRKREAHDGKPHTQTPDLDNLIKAFKDALLKNDSHIHTYNSMRKVWGISGKIVILE